MDATRRSFLIGAAATGVGACTFFRSFGVADPTTHFSTASHTPATHGLVPVVFDGKYIIDDPPKDTTGYFHPRDFEVKVGMSFTGNGNCTNLMATTAAPVGFPEQEIVDFEIESEGCAADIIALSETAAQFGLQANSLRAGQTVFAIAKYHLRVSMSHHGFSKEQFPADQRKASRVFAKKFLRNSTGIKCNTKAVKNIVRELVTEETHPWDAAKIFQSWVWENIKGVPGEYTSVSEAIKNRSGDCEERAAVFIALCRAAAIPARLVWVPGHNWAEFGLLDGDGVPHWIPVHTAAYSWFGWTGAHEIVMQKGDNIHIPHRKRTLRLVDDWYRIKGPRPELLYSASIIPIPTAEGADPGPGQREKQPTGVWELTGDHPRNEYMRDK